MRALSAAEVLSVWEAGAGSSPIDRALLLLGAALPERGWEALARLPLGARDRRLTEIWAAAFGDRIPLYARCAACGEGSELGVAAGELLGDATAEGEGPREAAVSGGVIRFRPVDSQDLLAVAGLETEDAEERLLARCVLAARIDGRDVEAGALSPEVRGELARAMAAADSHAEITLALRCPACGHGWRMPFDVLTVLWARIEREAGQLLQQIDALARVYGWREADVLALSPVRRALYLEMVL